MSCLLNEPAWFLANSYRPGDGCSSCGLFGIFFTAVDHREHIHRHDHTGLHDHDGCASESTIGTAIHLVDAAIVGGNRWIRARHSEAGRRDRPSHTRTTRPPSVSIAGGGHWVAMRLEVTNDGPTRFAKRGIALLADARVPD